MSFYYYPQSELNYEIAFTYKLGATIKDIANVFNVHPSVIRYPLMALNIYQKTSGYIKKGRPRQKQISEKNLEVFYHYQQFRNSKLTAEKFGISVGRVHQILKKFV